MAKGYHDSATPKNVRDLWRTPQWLFDAFNEWHGFTTDVAARAHNAKCEHFLTEADDALSCDWGEMNWCNPPYSALSVWIDKAIEQAEKGNASVVLVPADTGTGWFKRAFYACDEMNLIHGRIAFISELTGKPVKNNNKASVAFHFNGCANQTVIMRDRDNMKAEFEYGC